MWIKPLKYNAAKEKEVMEVSRGVLVPEVGRLRGAGSHILSLQKHMALP
jgi:hypothetical protein